MASGGNTISLTSVQAASATSFYESVGVNTHIDFSWTAYGNFSEVESALAYLGVAKVRDSIDDPADPAKLAQLNKDLGIKFDVYISPGSVGFAWQLQQIEANIGIISDVEGPNESDSESYSYNGLTGTAVAGAEQSALYSAIKSDAAASGVKVIESSFGQVSTFGTLKAIGNADYANAHVYFGTDNNPGWNGWIPYVMGLAQDIAPGKQVAITETGYSTATGSASDVDDTVQAKYTLDDILDEFQDGAPVINLYELVDEQNDRGDAEDNFGLFNNNWTPKPAATAVRNLLSILKDTGSVAAPGALTYGLSGMPTAGNSQLFEKSNGTFVLALWNDTRLASATTGADLTVAPVTVTLSLAQEFGTIDVYDPLSGSSPVQVASNAQSLQISLPDHPILITLSQPASAKAAVTSPVLNVPSRETVAATTTAAIAGISIKDAFAAGNAGNLMLGVWDSSGKLAMKNAGGASLAGSGSDSISYSGSYANIVAALASLTYTAAGTAGSDTINLSLFDQSGSSTSQTITVTITAPPLSGPVLTVPGNETVSASATLAIGGVSLRDAFAAANAGNLMLNVWDSSGKLTMKNASGASLPGSGSGSITYSGSYAAIVAALSSLSYTAAGQVGRDTIGLSLYDQAGSSTQQTVGVTVTAAGPVLSVPSSEAVKGSATIAVSGIVLTDSFAAGNAGSMALGVWDSSGTLSMKNASGATVAGSASTSISYTGSYADIVAALASLTYAAAGTAGSDAIHVSLYDQAGHSTEAAVAVTVSAPVYSWGASSGNTTINNGTGGITAAHGQVNVQGSVSDQDLWFVRNGNDLQVDILGSPDKLTIAGWYASAADQVSQFDAGGLKLDSSISTLVQAMATYSAGHGAFNPQATGATMPQDGTLQHVIAAAWHK